MNFFAKGFSVPFGARVCLGAMALTCAQARADVGSILGTNTVGFAELAVPGGATAIVTVPFEACLGNGSAGMLADLVSTNGLTSSVDDPTAADQLVVLTTNGTDLVYYYYWYQTGLGWTAVTTDKLMPDGSHQSVTPAAADAFAIARGLGFWVKRPAAGNATLFLKGQVATVKQSTEIRTGLNLVGYGTLTVFTLNDPGIDWTGAYASTNGNTSASDKIIVVNSDGTFTEYFYFVKPDDPAWDTYADIDHMWIDKHYERASSTIPSGRGFWYFRRGSEPFLFKPDGE
jgi:hypothetical protein